VKPLQKLFHRCFCVCGGSKEDADYLLFLLGLPPAQSPRGHHTCHQLVLGVEQISDNINIGLLLSRRDDQSGRVHLHHSCDGALGLLEVLSTEPGDDALHSCDLQDAQNTKTSCELSQVDQRHGVDTVERVAQVKALGDVSTAVSLPQLTDLWLDAGC